MKHKIPWAVWPLLALVLVVALAFSLRGFFNTPDMELVKLPAMKVVYADHTGPYQQASGWLMKFSVAAAGDHVGCRDYWGQYDDNPLLVAPDKLRSRLGCIADSVPAKLSDGLKVLDVPARTYVRMERTTDNQRVSVKNCLLMKQFAEKNDVLPDDYLVELYNPQKDRPRHATMLLPVTAPEK